MLFRPNYNVNIRDNLPISCKRNQSSQQDAVPTSYDADKSGALAVVHDTDV
jgi:hypothetical protein